MSSQPQSRMKWCEIVRVDVPAFLVNAQHRACRYETRDGAALARGFYLALRPSDVQPLFYGHDVCFLGPFASREAAVMLRASALEFGFVDDDSIGVRIPAPEVPSSLRHAFMRMARDVTLNAPAGHAACVSKTGDTSYTPFSLHGV